MRSIAAIAMLALLLVLGGGGSLLSRLDRTQAEYRLHVAESRLARAQLRLELVRVWLAHRSVKPANDPRVEILVRRTDALRGAIFALVRTGRVSMPGDPGGDWVVWPLELADVGSEVP